MTDEPILECRFCCYVNAAGAQRCKDCGAWLPSQKSPSTEDQEAVAEAVEQTCLRDQLLAMLRERKTIEAVKLYRAEMGVGLKEAKEVIEELADKHNLSTPGVGCTGVLLVLLAASGTLLAILC